MPKLASLMAAIFALQDHLPADEIFYEIKLSINDRCKLKSVLY